MRSAESIIEACIGLAISIHRSLGPGLLESAYQRILRDELLLAGYRVEVEPIVSVVYNGREYANSFRADLIVDRMVVLELKCTERIAPVHKAQLLTYLRCLRIRNGLLVNFGLERAVDGIFRVTNFQVDA